MLKCILILEGEHETNHCLPLVQAAPCSQSFRQERMGCGLGSSSALFVSGTIPLAGEDLLLAPSWLVEWLRGCRRGAPGTVGAARAGSVVWGGTSCTSPVLEAGSSGCVLRHWAGRRSTAGPAVPCSCHPHQRSVRLGGRQPPGTAHGRVGWLCPGTAHRCWAPTPRARTGEKWSLLGKVELSSALPSPADKADLAAADLGLQHPDTWPCSARERFLALDESEVRAVSGADLQSAGSSRRMGFTERGGRNQARAWAELKLKTLLLTLAGKEMLQMLEE